MGKLQNLGENSTTSADDMQLQASRAIFPRAICNDIAFREIFLI